MTRPHTLPLKMHTYTTYCAFRKDVCCLIGKIRSFWNNKKSFKTNQKKKSNQSTSWRNKILKDSGCIVWLTVKIVENQISKDLFSFSFMFRLLKNCWLKLQGCFKQEAELIKTKKKKESSCIIFNLYFWLPQRHLVSFSNNDFKIWAQALCCLIGYTTCKSNKLGFPAQAS